MEILLTSDGSADAHDVVLLYNQNLTECQPCTSSHPLVTYLRHRLQLFNSSIVERTRIGLEVANLELAL